MYSEMTLFHHLHGYDLGKRFTIIQKRHGFHADGQYSIEFPGPTGQKNMFRMLKELRERPFTPIGAYRVEAFDDYLAQVHKDDHGQTMIPLPPSDVVKFSLHEGSSIIVRPSGTEPKCKFYYSAVGKTEAELKDKISGLHAALLATYNIKN